MRDIDFIHNEVVEPFARNDSIERAMYDEIFGPLIQRPSTNSTKLPLLQTQENPFSCTNSSTSLMSSPVKSEQQNIIPSTDFNTTIVKRLTEAEKTEKILRKQLAELIVKNDSLTRQNQELSIQLKVATATKGLESLEDVKEVANLRAENDEFRTQIREMEKFLRDYGLTWVGYRSKSESQYLSDEDCKEDGNEYCDEDRVNTREMCPMRKANADLAKAFHLENYDLICKRIDELNAMIHEEPVQIKTIGDSKKKHKFVYASEVVENIPVAFYSNGILIKRGPIRSVGSAGYKSFLRDVLDGFFPTEFRGEYPDGMLLTAIDRRDQEYTNDENCIALSSSRGQFLGRLPSTVVRNGNIVDVRGSIEARLFNDGDRYSGNDSTCSVDNTNNAVKASNEKVEKKVGIIHLKTPAALLESEGGYSASKTTVIRIKWLEGRDVLVAKMFESDLISELIEQIRQHFAGTGHGAEVKCPEFHLRNAYPSQLLIDGQTLADAGLIPNGTVHAKAI